MTQELIDFLSAISATVVLFAAAFIVLKIAKKNGEDDPLIFLFFGAILIAVGTFVATVVLFWQWIGSL